MSVFWVAQQLAGPGYCYDKHGNLWHITKDGTRAWRIEVISEPLPTYSNIGHNNTINKQEKNNERMDYR